MIQCIGPAEKYCSRTCCATALVNALKLKELNPDAQVTILYKDMRTFGFKERLYTEARRAGILFIRYDDSSPPPNLQYPIPHLHESVGADDGPRDDADAGYGRAE